MFSNPYNSEEKNPKIGVKKLGFIIASDLADSADVSVDQLHPVQQAVGTTFPTCRIHGASENPSQNLCHPAASVRPLALFV